MDKDNKNTELDNTDKKLHISDVSCSISYNESEEMMAIRDKNGKTVFYGNYWDFDREPQSLSKLLTLLGLKVGLDGELESVG
jgi:hypothetical protein